MITLFFLLWKLVRWVILVVVGLVVLVCSYCPHEVWEACTLDLNQHHVPPGRYLPISELDGWQVASFEVAEDERFGIRESPIEWRGIGRAVVKDITLHRHEGGSSIPQQAARAGYLENPTERSFKRKIAEGLTSYRLTRSKSRDFIFEVWTNNIDYGGCFRGLRNASEYWFGRPPRELAPLELYALVVSIRAPSYYNTSDKLRDAAKLYVRNAQARGFFEKDAQPDVSTMRFVHDKVTRFVVAGSALRDDAPPAFRADAMRSLPPEVREQVRQGRAKLRYTYDGALQAGVQAIASEELEKLETAHQMPLEMSVVVQDMDGRVCAMAQKETSREYSFGCQSQRQIGSLEKPLVVMAARLSGVVQSLNDEVLDEPLANGWPANGGRPYHGRVSLFTALAQSYNPPFVRLCQQPQVTGWLGELHREMHLPAIDPADAGVALGTVMETNVQICSVYQALASGGVYVTPTFVDAVVDAESGKVIYRPVVEREMVCPAGIAGEICDALHGALKHGTLHALPKTLQGAGKSGTTSTGRGGETRDLRCIYLLPNHLVISLWVGRENGDALWEGASGGGALAPLMGRVAVFVEGYFTNGEKGGAKVVER